MKTALSLFAAALIISGSSFADDTATATTTTTTPNNSLTAIAKAKAKARNKKKKKVAVLEQSAKIESTSNVQPASVNVAANSTETAGMSNTTKTGMTDVKPETAKKVKGMIYINAGASIDSIKDLKATGTEMTGNVAQVGYTINKSNSIHYRQNFDLYPNTGLAGKAKYEIAEAQIGYVGVSHNTENGILGSEPVNVVARVGLPQTKANKAKFDTQLVLIGATEYKIDPKWSVGVQGSISESVKSFKSASTATAIQVNGNYSLSDATNFYVSAIPQLVNSSSILGIEVGGSFDVNPKLNINPLIYTQSGMAKPTVSKLYSHDTTVLGVAATAKF
jgi:hypothetical protein